MRQVLRRAGGSLIMTIPKAFIAQNDLQPGTEVELAMNGATMTLVVPSRPEFALEALLAECSAKEPEPMSLLAWRTGNPVGAKR